jgi:ubiquinone/menaquinone biosynthesis C-methylase UbiE
MEAATTTTVIQPDHIPVPDGTAELVLIIFSAHELRDADTRVRLFGEVFRVIGASGRVFVVEHQRDAWNFLAYGPGFFHFLSRSTWFATFTQAHLKVVRDSTITPWVHCYELRAIS